MKKVLLTTFIALLIIPLKVHALTGSVSITCNHEGLYEDTPTTCTISGTSSAPVTGFQATITYDADEITVSPFTTSVDWVSFGINSLSPGGQIQLVANAEDNHIVTGEFDILTFEVTLAEGATTSQQTITLSDISFYDVDIATFNISNGTHTATFEDYITLGSYTVDTAKMIIRNLTPMTIGTFTNAISSNAVLQVFDKTNNLLNSLSTLATGQTLKATYKTHNTSYKVSIKGDVLGNGSVTVNDGKEIAKHIIDGNIITGDEYLMAADYDNNNVIKMNDVMRLLYDIQN